MAKKKTKKNKVTKQWAIINIADNMVCAVHVRNSYNDALDLGVEMVMEQISAEDNVQPANVRAELAHDGWYSPMVMSLRYHEWCVEVMEVCQQ